ncbi:MAG: putative HMP/thiamine import ATP-binding protein YkoD [Smithella sp. PtaU1.Bin162]|nr:MAG: putative HMP/thiamine import ATP-binding protein YkoD [Smithella sp. PtaU1.Bin162]
MKNNLLFELRNVTYEIDEHRRFAHIDWQAASGETWAVYGAAGSGKSSLCSIFQSLRLVKEGELKLHFLEGKPDDSVYREVVEVSFTSTPVHWGGSYYQQRYTPSQIVDVPTVAEYLNIDPSNSAIADELLETFHLAEFKNSACIKLSNGQMRKLLIVEALMQKPSLLILDNPFTGLDMEGRKVLDEKLTLLAARGQLIIFLINHLRDLPTCVTHVLELEKFQVKRAGPKDELPEEKSTSELSAATDTYPKLLHPIPRSYEFAVALRNVTIEYEGKRVLDNISWTVRKGEKWALTGGNGSGKSTLLSLITADNTQAYEKEIYLFDRRRGSGETIWDIKEQIGFLSPELHLYFTKALTCTQVVTSGLNDTMLAKAHLSDKEKQSMQSFFTYFSLNDLSRRYFQRISKTEQRIVLLIRALIKNAEMLILDEPYHYFDEQLIRRTNRLLDWYCRDKTLIFVTHHPEEIPASVNQRMHMNAGVGKIISICYSEEPG